MNTITYSDDLTAYEYNELRTAVGWFRLTDKQAEQGLQNTTFLICARENSKIIAMGRAWFDFGYTVYIGDVIIIPEYQRNGMGTYIVNELMKQVVDAAEKGDTIMFFLSAAKGKEPFYEKLGFQNTPNETAGAGMRMTITK